MYWQAIVARNLVVLPQGGMSHLWQYACQSGRAERQRTGRQMRKPPPSATLLLNLPDRCRTKSAVFLLDKMSSFGGSLVFMNGLGLFDRPPFGKVFGEPGHFK